MKRPNEGEYNPYFQKYIDLVKSDTFFEELKNNTSETNHFFSTIPTEKHEYKYAENKWTIKQVLMHLIDTERVFSYRALVGARGDSTTQIQSFDDELYAANVDANKRTMESLLEEFKSVRRSAEMLFENITEAQSEFKANAGTYAITPRALGFIMIGHVQHHVNIVKERYL